MSSFFLRTLLEASSFRSVQNTNGTALMDDDVVGSVLKNATTIMDTASRSSSDEPSFDWPSFFWSWGINLLLLIIIMGLTVYCWKINGCARFYTVQTHETDLIYQRNQLEREQQQRERKVLSPEQRTKMLMESFERTKAISVRVFVCWLFCGCVKFFVEACVLMFLLPNNTMRNCRRSRTEILSKNTI